LGGVMGALIGLLLGAGVLLMIVGFTQPSRPIRVRVQSQYFSRLAQQSGIPRLTGIALMGLCITSSVIAAVLVVLITAVPMVALIAALASGWIPILLIRRRGRIHQKAVRKAWPDVVDSLLSAVRAGLSLPEAVCELGVKGPLALRVQFADFTADYRASGSFIESLNSLGTQLADPVADRVIAALRIAREVGGNDLGSVLRTLSLLLREDARVRGEIEARQSWTINAARLAVAAPWITLALLSTRPEAMRAYNSAAGAVVLIAASGLSFIAYRSMMLVSRLPTEPRLVKS
jgi:tight adherence protein B